MNDIANIISDSVNSVNSIDFGQLNSLGLHKMLETNFWPGHTIISYPFYDELKHNSRLEELFEHLKETNTGSYNLYFHIPYCTGICTYCAYSKSSTKNLERKSRYLIALFEELEMWKSHLNKDSFLADSIYLGGGTPTELPINLFGDLIQKINEHVVLSANSELTCEASPETLLGESGREKILLLKQHSFNRISIGIQSFSDRICETITGRRHGRADSIEAINNVFDAGFEKLNIDLMYGLPSQTIDSWIDSLGLAVQMDIPSITLYPFKVKKFSVWSKSYNKNPDQFEWAASHALTLVAIAKRFLEENGYVQYNVYWFVKDDSFTFKQQKEKYKMSNLLGFGCSSYSYVNDSQYFNLYSEMEYINAVNKGQLPIDVGRVLTKEEQIKRYLIFGLKKGFHADSFFETFQCYPKDCFDIFDVLEGANLVVIENGFYILSDLGKLFSDEIGVAISKKNVSESVIN